MIPQRQRQYVHQTRALKLINKRSQISGQDRSGSDGNYCTARSGDRKPRSLSWMSKHGWIKGYSLISSVLSSSSRDITGVPMEAFKNSSLYSVGSSKYNAPITQFWHPSWRKQWHKKNLNACQLVSRYEKEMRLTERLGLLTSPS